MSNPPAVSNAVAYAPRTGWRRLRPRHLAIFALMAVGNYLCATLGYTFAIKPANVAIVWPGSGFVLAVLLLLKSRHWPAVLLGAIAGNMVADMQHGATGLNALLGSAANGFEGFVAALVVIRLAGRGLTLGTLREVAALVLGAVVGSNALTSFAGALFLSHASYHDFWRSWFAWWTGDGLGMLIIAPVVLTLVDMARSRHRPPWRRAAEAALVCAAIAVVTYNVHLDGTGSRSDGVTSPYLAFPLLLFSAVRYGPWGAALAALSLAAATEWNAALAISPFSEPQGTAARQVFETYTYLALASLSALIPAAVLRERERVEERLRESEQRFREMAEHIHEAFFVTDLASGRPLYVSPTWAEIWGRPMSDAYDPHAWFYAIHPDDRPAMVAAQAATAKGEPTDVLFRVRRPDESERWVRGRAFPVRDEAGVVYRVAGVAEDVTELRRIEEGVAQSKRMEAVGQLAGGVAHDFNNILTVVMSHSEMLLDELPPDDRRRGDIESILQAATSASQLTRQLLLFSRKEVLQPETFRLSGVIANVTKMLKRLIGEHVDLVVQDDASGSVRADPGSIEQVVVNLAVNARDAMPEGGRLTITTRNVEGGTPSAAAACPPGPHVALIVRDTGTGMDDATKARIFEPFFSTKPRGKGTGLGLATVHGVVADAGGRIAVESVPGKGTTFTIYLPRVPDATAAPASAPAEAPPRGTETVLVVEDEPAVRTLVCRMLSSLGYHVLQAPDGETALSIGGRDRRPIHLLLTDVVMPGMSGRALADRFVPLHPESRILFMSGYTDDQVLHQGVVGAELQFVEKPLTALKLARKVRAVLDARPVSARSLLPL